MNIGARIKELRGKSRINQEQLAENIKVSRGNVGDWERGRAKPGADALLSLWRSSSRFQSIGFWKVNPFRPTKTHAY
ncbi:helix-turn-helix domain-containing protein [Paenibacillus eucommiae]|uniref:DNA-binding XRE family transcriptional regulator n=1 Tax=Paenibacillus eucommiae TaxID=1355755 RepID=A0ABS4J8J2_9BACL|nr:DNA-binding XRE family transcriptional regulator [Paenibacillus eucommiae]